MPKFKTCDACGSAELVGILQRTCPGCGTPYPLAPIAATPAIPKVHLTLSGRNDNPIGYRAVYADDVQIGVVFREYGQTWRAEDMQHKLHGTQYTSDWNAAKQLALGLGMRPE